LSAGLSSLGDFLQRIIGCNSQGSARLDISVFLGFFLTQQIFKHLDSSIQFGLQSQASVGLPQFTKFSFFYVSLSFIVGEHTDALTAA